MLADRVLVYVWYFKSNKKSPNDKSNSDYIMWPQYHDILE